MLYLLLFLLLLFLLLMRSKCYGLTNKSQDRTQDQRPDQAKMTNTLTHTHKHNSENFFLPRALSKPQAVGMRVSHSHTNATQQLNNTQKRQLQNNAVLYLLAVAAIDGWNICRFFTLHQSTRTFTASFLCMQFT